MFGNTPKEWFRKKCHLVTSDFLHGFWWCRNPVFPGVIKWAHGDLPTRWTLERRDWGAPAESRPEALRRSSQSGYLKGIRTKLSSSYPSCSYLSSWCGLLITLAILGIQDLLLIITRLADACERDCRGVRWLGPAGCGGVLISGVTLSALSFTAMLPFLIELRTIGRSRSARGYHYWALLLGLGWSPVSSLVIFHSQNLFLSHFLEVIKSGFSYSSSWFFLHFWLIQLHHHHHHHYQDFIFFSKIKNKKIVKPKAFLIMELTLDNAFLVESWIKNWELNSWSVTSNLNL